MKTLATFTAALSLSAGCLVGSPTLPESEEPEIASICNMDPDQAVTARERDWLRRTPVCAITDNDGVYIRENCLGRHAPNGLPCKVCVGFVGCITPYLDMYCVNQALGCQDPSCLPDRPLR